MTSSDTLLDALTEAEKIWPHNESAIADTAVELAVIAALAKPTDAPNGRALLRRAGDHSSDVAPLFSERFGKAVGLWSDFDFFAAPCDRCARDVQPAHALWVPAGATVVELHCCQRCRDELDADLPDLAWN